jgi:hypothetical protein
MSGALPVSDGCGGDTAIDYPPKVLMSIQTPPSRPKFLHLTRLNLHGVYSVMSVLQMSFSKLNR